MAIKRIEIDSPSDCLEINSNDAVFVPLNEVDFPTVKITYNF